MADPIEAPVDALVFCCPRCEQPHTDDYEVLCTNVMAEWRCSNCHRLFSVLMTECAHCAYESMEVGLSPNELSARPSNAPCPDCGKPPPCHEEDEDPFGW